MAATVGLCVLAIVLGILFEHQTIAFIVSLTFSIAASSNFPVLVLSIYWRGLTTRGAVVGGSLGLASAVALTILSPTVWVKVLGHAAPIYPYEYPALFSMLVAFAGIYLFSVTDKSQRARIEQRAYADQLVVSELGVKAAAVTRSA